jgi:acyl transferase domain-containing protein/NADPH:quinone reductase-like Zn-dependent oxidoreductase/NAD(P)-dependent dehydrogenase (short-subunit alcohol dehydrogenase family)/acyl carrier protein
MPLPKNDVLEQSEDERLAARLASLSPAQRDLLKKKLAQRAAQSVLRAKPAQHDSDANAIAIVGMGCRFPGANSLDEYWDLIQRGGEAVGKVPAERWDRERFFDPTGRTPGKMSVDAIGAIENVDQFDPAFFGIAPREAARMDPQQRLLLEVTWETFENAGIPIDSMQGSSTGVFIGIGGTDYSKVPARYPDYFDHIDAHIGTGNALSIAAGRISYLFDFRGPSFIVDTACSSALVAIHSAVVSLLRGESTAAVAGGVNLILSPETTIAFSKARMLSPDGHCRPFDNQANGYVRGEGCGLVLLKRLADAQQAGDQILGLIRGTAVNQDGRTSGITAPSSEAQQRCIQSALATAGIAVDDVTYIEAHGTGTPLGDPIELLALSQTFASRDRDLPPIRIGSVKANIGHTETASGIAGLIKVVMMLARGQIPAQANFNTLNTNVRLHEDILRVADSSQVWQPSTNGRLIAGVSSFGFGGTNAHLIVEKPTTEVPQPKNTELAPEVLCLPFSATDATALADLSHRLQATLLMNADKAANVCAVAATQRTALTVRAVAVGRSVAELKASLADLPSLIQGRKPAGRRPRIAMLFTGQGSQYAGMAAGLARNLPSFQRALQRCEEILDPVIGCSLRDVLDGSSQITIDHTSLAQPAICAIQCAMVDSFAELDIRPDVVAGHSIGEIAALYAAGAFSLQQALLVSAYRGQSMGGLPPGGAMAAVLTDAAQVASWISQADSSAVIATMNGESNTVIAGSHAAVETVLQIAQANDAAFRRLTVSHAFHSPLMQPAAQPLRERLSGVFDVVKIPSHLTFISSLTGQRHQGPIDVDYWIRHLLQPVRFTEVMAVLNESKLDLAIEVGPTPQLCGMLRRSGSAEHPPVTAVATLHPQQDDLAGWMKAVANAWCVGAPVRWRSLQQFNPTKRIALPTYPFQRQRFWHASPKLGHNGISGPILHPLLGVKQSLATGGAIYTTVIRDNEPSYLGDHVVSGSITVPAAAWIETLQAATEDVFASGYTLENISIDRALFLEAGTSVAIQTSALVSGARCKLQIAARRDGEDTTWETCATAVGIKGSETIQPIPAGDPVAESIDSAAFYQAMSRSKLEYGQFFQVLRQIKSDGQIASGLLTVDDQLTFELQRYKLHPTLLDGALQLIASIVPKQDSDRTFLPVGVERLRLATGGPIVAARAQRCEPSNDTTTFNRIVANVQLLDAEERVVADLRGVQLQSLQQERGRDENPSHWIHEVTWSAIELASASDQSHPSLVYHGSQRLADVLPAPFEDQAVRREHWIWSTPIVERDGECRQFTDVQQATESLLQTIQAAIRADSNPRLSIITERAFQLSDEDAVCPIAASIVGLVRVAGMEHPQLSIRLLDVPAADENNAEFMEAWLGSATDETELACRHGGFYSPRLTPQPHLLGDDDGEISLPRHGSYRIRLDGTNRTEGLWVERIAPPTADCGEVAVQISAVGLNFSDVLKSIGLYPGIDDKVVPMGIEICGTVTEKGADVSDLQIGQRVMGIVPYGFASNDATNDYLLIPVPDHLNDEEAASIPVVFMTAHHALCHVARLRKGESVLIHAGAGGVGIAAIQVAQSLGAEVYTTAGSSVKRTLLASMGVRHIFDSRDLRSIEAIRELTGGRGVDVVLNSLPGDWIDASLGLLAAHGRFLEIGKTDIYQDRPLGLLPFQDNLTYSAIDLDRIFRHRPAEVRQLFAEVAQRFRDGVYQPLPITSFRLDELPTALRFMAARRNIGKIVVQPPKFVADLVADSDGLHLITGGSGAIARGVARRLIQRGAKAIALVARREPTQEILDFCKWAADQHAKCYYLQADCACEQSLRTALNGIPEPDRHIVGVVHAAGLLDDGLIHELSPESLRRVLHPKVAGAIALDRVTADHPVKSFAMLGSIAAVFGSPGQANYAAANAFLEGFALDRRRRGLPASVVHWGPWGTASTSSDAGMAADPTRVRNLASRGLRPLDFDHAIDLLIDLAMLDLKSPPIVVDANFKKMLGGTGTVPSVLRSVKVEGNEGSGGTESLVDTALLSELAAMELPERSERLSRFFAEQLGKIISMNPAAIDPAQSLGSLGLDSLMAIELKNTIEAKLAISIPIGKFMDDPTLASLAEAAANLVSTAKDNVQETSAQATIPLR